MSTSNARFKKWARSAPYILQCLGLLASALLLFAAAPASALAQVEITGTPQPSTLVSPEFTPLPAEYYHTEQQSAGIVLGAVLLVLIILITSLSVLHRPRRKEQ